MTKSRNTPRYTTPRRLAALCVFACGLATSASAGAALLFTGSGTNPETGNVDQSASAVFSLSADGKTLTLVLTNTTPVTAVLGDTLTGILFDAKGSSATLSLTSIDVASGDALWEHTGKGKNLAWSKQATTNITGAWTSELAKPAIGTYGIATTGFNGMFNAGNIKLGSGGADYGIVGAGTFPAGINGGLSPFADDALTFTMAVSGSLTESELADVVFLFGTSGQGIIPNAPPITPTPVITEAAVPEPSLLALLGVAAAAVRTTRRKEHRA